MQVLVGKSRLPEHERVEHVDPDGHGPFEGTTYADRMQNLPDLDIGPDDRDRAIADFCLGLGLVALCSFPLASLYG